MWVSLECGFRSAAGYATNTVPDTLLSTGQGCSVHCDLLHNSTCCSQAARSSGSDTCKFLQQRLHFARLLGLMRRELAFV